MTFIDFIHKHNLEKKATSNIKIYEVLKKLGLGSKVGIYLGDGPFDIDIGIVNLHPSKGTHWDCYINEKNFDGYAVVCPKKLSNSFIKRNGHCSYSEYQIQRNDSYCASYWF